MGIECFGKLGCLNSVVRSLWYSSAALGAMPNVRVSKMGPHNDEILECQLETWGWPESDQTVILLPSLYGKANISAGAWHVVKVSRSNCWSPQKRYCAY